MALLIIKVVAISFILVISLFITSYNNLSIILQDFKAFNEEPKFHINEPLSLIIFKAIVNSLEIYFIIFFVSPKSRFIFFSLNKGIISVIDEGSFVSFIAKNSENDPLGIKYFIKLKSLYTNLYV